MSQLGFGGTVWDWVRVRDRSRVIIRVRVRQHKVRVRVWFIVGVSVWVRSALGLCSGSVLGSWLELPLGLGLGSGS